MGGVGGRPGEQGSSKEEETSNLVSYNCMLLRKTQTLSSQKTECGQDLKEPRINEGIQLKREVLM